MPPLASPSWWEAFSVLVTREQGGRTCPVPVWDCRHKGVAGVALPREGCSGAGRAPGPQGIQGLWDPRSQ